MECEKRVQGKRRSCNAAADHTSGQRRRCSCVHTAWLPCAWAMQSGFNYGPPAVLQPPLLLLLLGLRDALLQLKAAA